MTDDWLDLPDPPEVPSWDLDMPFVTVASKGGPHDDVAYSAGWSMAWLDLRLDSAMKPSISTQVISRDCLPQAELIVMKHGGQMKELPPDDDPEAAGWVEEWARVEISLGY